MQPKKKKKRIFEVLKNNVIFFFSLLGIIIKICFLLSPSTNSAALEVFVQASLSNVICRRGCGVKGHVLLTFGELLPDWSLKKKVIPIYTYTKRAPGYSLTHPSQCWMFANLMAKQCYGTVLWVDHKFLMFTGHLHFFACELYVPILCPFSSCVWLFLLVFGRSHIFVCLLPSLFPIPCFIFSLPLGILFVYFFMTCPTPYH